MCDLLIPALLVGGALLAFSGAGCESGCYTPVASYSACSSYGFTPCASAVYGSPRTHFASSYSYAAGYAPTPGYMSGSQYYGYSGAYTAGYTGVSAGYTNPYANSSQYYYY